MSHHTSLSVKYSTTSINFPHVQSRFELSLGKASSDAAGGGYISQPPSITSGVLLRSSVQSSVIPLSFAYYMTRHFVAIALWCLEKKNQHIGPIPHPLPSLALLYLTALVHS